MVKGMIGAAITCCLLAMGCASHRPDWRSPYTKLSSLEEGDIVHLQTGVKITREQLMDMLSCATIIYVAETHDNVNSHKVQLEILKELLQRNPHHVSVGMEMLKRSSQEAADQWISGQLDEKDFVKVWVENWSNDFEYYRSLLQYMRENRIPLVALQALDDWIDITKGETESPNKLKEMEEPMPELDFTDPYHRAHIRAIFGGHPMGGLDFDTFYRVQVLWDESMAESIAAYLQGKNGQHEQMLVLAGGHHIQYGFGIPRRVFRRLPVPYAIVLPMTVHIAPEKRSKLMDVTLPENPFRPGDFAWIVSYEDLSDQMVYLGVIVHDTDEGVKVLGTVSNSTAEKAGVQKDDILTALDGEPVKTKFDLTYYMGLKRPGQTGTIEVLRNDETLRFDVTFQTWHVDGASAHDSNMEATEHQMDTSTDEE